MQTITVKHVLILQRTIQYKSQTYKLKNNINTKQIIAMGYSV